VLLSGRTASSLSHKTAGMGRTRGLSAVTKAANGFTARLVAEAPKAGPLVKAQNCTSRYLSTTPKADAQPSTEAIVELTSPADFETLVIAASQRAAPVGGPVLLDLYADWCEPCKVLTPKLEKLVLAAKGALRLAKVNVDKLPQIAQALQVTSLPTVMLVHKGKLVDSFQGVLPDAELAKFVNRASELAGGSNTPARAMEAAATTLESGDVAGATAAYAELSALPEHAAAANAGLALCALKDGDLALAQDLIATLHKKFPEAIGTDALVRKAVSKVELAAAAGNGTRPAAALEQMLKEDPSSHEVRYELAQSLMASDETERAVDELLTILKKEKTWNDGAARKLLLQIFDSLGFSHEITKKGRRRLANIMLI